MITAAVVFSPGRPGPIYAQNRVGPDRIIHLAPAKSNAPRIARKKIVGIEAIKREVGAAIPTGRGVPACHVEGMPGDYLPRRSLPEFRNVRFIAHSGPSKSNSHATATARTIYGVNGMAPGISDVHCYASADWIGDGYLHAWSDRPPTMDDRRVFSQSWIRPTGGAISRDVDRRVDYLVDTRDVIMVVGVNNGRNTAVPAQLASAYNVIAMGVRTGDNSGGYTWFEGRGRCKPDLVAIGGKTSFSTPTVAGLAARLLEMADRMAASDPAAANAKRSEVIKAVLMAGAQKRDGWKREQGHPLDDHLGAGFARFDHSYHILTAGPSPAGTIDAAHGWDFTEVPAGEQAVRYDFDLARPVREFSIILTWNRRIGSGGNIILRSGKVLWDTTPRLANFNLELIHLDAAAGPATVEESISRVDNVEHIYRKRLGKGHYQLVVRRIDAINEPWEYALAWRSQPEGRRKNPKPPPPDPAN